MTSPPTIDVRLLGASFFSTNHASAADAVAGREHPLTAPTFPLLVARARRFTSLVTQMHIEVCGALANDAAEPPITVFATCHGEIQTAEMLIADFRANAMVGSARFALSVHNSPSGLYSVATRSTAPSTTITGANAIAAGWLEAALTALDAGRTVLLSIADEPVPAVFQGPPLSVGVAAAFLLGPGASAGRGAQLAISPCTDGAEIDPLHVLARAVDAAIGAAPATVALGRIQPGATLDQVLMSSEFGPLTDYLPHRPPMLLIDRIDEVTTDRAVCRATIRPDCVFGQDGRVHPSAMIEFVAQACAIYVGVRASRDGDPPRLGFIVGCREIAFAVDHFAVGDELTIAVGKVLGEDLLAVFNGTVSRGGEVCVTIQLSVVDGELAGTQFSTAGAGAEA